MDPVTHSLAALVLGRACLPAQRARATRYATAALVVAANVPDLDILYWLAGPLPFLEHNRGWTHSVAAAAALAVPVALVTQALGRRRGHEIPLRLLLPLCLAGAASHLLLDWATADGTRLLWPLKSARYALDWFPTIDPWLLALLLLGLGLPALLRLILEEIGARRKEGVSKGAWVALAACALLAGGRATWQAGAVEQLESRLYRNRMPVRAAAFPLPLTPLTWRGVVETGTTFETLEVTRGRSAETFSTFYKPAPSPALVAALETRTAEVFLAWARFPHVEISPTNAGWRVRLRDLRYADDAPRFRRVAAWIELDENLKVLQEVAGSGDDADN